MKNAWHTLGTDVRGGRSASSAMMAAGLGWDVWTETLVTGWNGFQVSGQSALVTGNRVLSVVGSRHRIIQNSELVPMLDVLREDGEFYAAGQTGSVVFVTIQRKDGHLVSLVNGHDTKTPLSVVFTPVAGPALLDARWERVELSAKGAGAALQQVDNWVWGATFNQEILRGKAMSEGRFKLLIAEKYRAVEGASAATETRTLNKLDIMSALFRGGTTAYDGYVALCTWFDHHSPVRAPDENLARARKAIFEPKFKRQALELMTSL